MPSLNTIVAKVVSSTGSVGPVEEVNLMFDSNNFSVTATDSSAAPPLTRVIRGEITLNKAGNAAIAASVVGVRGAVNVAAGTTVTAGYEYGVQGKLTVAGTLNNGSGFNAGLFGQLDMSAITAHTSGYLAPIIADFSTASALAADPLADMVVLLNTSQCLINSIVKTAAKANYLFDLGDLAQGAYIVSGAVGGSQDMKLKIKLNGTDYFIPCNTA